MPGAPYLLPPLGSQYLREPPLSFHQIKKPTGVYEGFGSAQSILTNTAASALFRVFFLSALSRQLDSQDHVMDATQMLNQSASYESECTDVVLVGRLAGDATG